MVAAQMNQGGNCILDRREVLLSMLNPDGVGLEVGPSYSPLLPKSKGYNVEIFDHADGPALRKKYHDNASQIEEVDYVSDGRGLLDIIGKPGRYDYIVASHVIEHIPDIVRFIQDCETLLKPGGVLVLAVPDKRYCFDTLRPDSTVGQTLQAYAEKRTRHPAGVVFDHINSICTKADAIVWVEPTLDDLKFMYSPDAARDKYEEAQTTPDYLDTHGWQFTPTFFEYLIKTLRGLNFIKSGVQSLQTNVSTGLHEFYVSLSMSAQTCLTSDLDLLRKAEREVRDIHVARIDAQRETEELLRLRSGAERETGELMRLHSEAERQTEELVRLRSEAERLRSESARFQSENAALKASTSWRVTSPLRYLRTLLG
jgi:predicted SAM-dependent methyltransferase